ncbi:MAG: GGDEF domain-containing protein [Gammaproteobacteria bacterium]|nr:GGDEF domain-containing protein [Gammaproteobacteria bacterium]
MQQSGGNIDLGVPERLHVKDIFVLRRVEKNRFVHVGGAGRGEGWAGMTELRLDSNAPARSAYDENRVVELSASDPVNVFGAYWARWSAFVPVDHDVIVIFGGVDRAEQRDADDLRETATNTAREIQEVSPAKQLADELEILHAIQHLMAWEPQSMRATMQHVVDCATEALSCEFGAMWLRDGEECVAKERGWSPGTDICRMAPAFTELLEAAAQSSLCIQDTSDQPLPQPFQQSNGVVSYYLLSLGNLATLLLLHTQVEPRGFTKLCQELGRRLADSSEVLLRTAMQRESLSREVARVSHQARSDPLTGLANRLGWDERLDKLAKERPAEPCGIICIDIDDLKNVNDSLGHEAGDNHIQAMATIVSDNVRPDDFVARLGGDELAVLLPGSAIESCSNIVSRLVEAAASHGGTRGFPLRFAYGLAVCEPGSDIYDTQRRADAILIRRKH